MEIKRLFFKRLGEMNFRVPKGNEDRESFSGGFSESVVLKRVNSLLVSRLCRFVWLGLHLVWQEESGRGVTDGGFIGNSVLAGLCV